MKVLSHKICFLMYHEYLRSCGYKEKTIASRLSGIKQFFAYLRKQESKDIREVSEKDLQGYLEYINNYISEKNGRLLSDTTKKMRVCIVRQLFTMLYKSEKILINPAQELYIRRQKKEKKKAVLTQKEMEILLDTIEHNADEKALRDRAIFEFMYSTGVRVSEVRNLKIKDIDFDGRIVLLRGAKWRKDRVVPLLKISLYYLKRVIRGRSKQKEAYVFPGVKGALSYSAICNRFKEWVQKAGIKKKNVTVHSIRHSVATHLFENGADIRYVQELLGHETIETTVRYTHELNENIKRIYKSYHPRENKYYKEVDREYRKRLQQFKERIILTRNQKQREAEYKRMWRKERREKEKKT